MDVQELITAKTLLIFILREPKQETTTLNSIYMCKHASYIVNIIKI